MCQDVLFVFIISDEVTLIANQDFEPKQMTYREIMDLLEAQRLEFMRNMTEGHQHRFERIKFRNYGNVDYTQAIPFKRGDKMKTIFPAIIG